MIKVSRIKKPASLVANKAAWDANLSAARLAGVQADIDKAEGKYNQKDIRDSLEAMFDNKCAYCECEIKSVSYTHIEHFRPKKKYPKKCFSWDNLLLACSRCNGKACKGELFPLTAEDGPLINPCKEDPAAFFEFEMVAGLALIKPFGKRASKTAGIFKLNTRPALVRRRTQLLNMLAYVHIAAQDGDVDAMAIMDEARTADFSAWVNALFP